VEETQTMAEKMPPWVDMEKLCWAICTCPTSVENYVAQGKLPPPRKLGAKRLWKWKEVEEWLANGAPNDRIGSISDAVRREREADETARH
jgi:hypothetical protein